MGKFKIHGNQTTNQLNHDPTELFVAIFSPTSCVRWSGITCEASLPWRYCIDGPVLIWPYPVHLRPRKMRWDLVSELDISGIPGYIWIYLVSEPSAIQLAIYYLHSEGVSRVLGYTAALAWVFQASGAFALLASGEGQNSIVKWEWTDFTHSDSQMAK